MTEELGEELEAMSPLKGRLLLEYEGMRAASTRKAKKLKVGSSRPMKTQADNEKQGPQGNSIDKEV